MTGRLSHLRSLSQCIGFSCVKTTVIEGLTSSRADGLKKKKRKKRRKDATGTAKPLKFIVDLML